MSGYGEILVNLRGDRTQKEVANAIGISMQSMSAYEKEERVPRDDVKRRLARYYDRSIAEIFFPDDHEKWSSAR